jgi:hypothetical protein
MPRGEVSSVAVLIQTTRCGVSGVVWMSDADVPASFGFLIRFAFPEAKEVRSEIREGEESWYVELE